MQQRKDHDGILYRINCGGKESGEFNKKGRGSPKIIIQNKGNLQSP